MSKNCEVINYRSVYNTENDYLLESSPRYALYKKEGVGIFVSNPYSYLVEEINKVGITKKTTTVEFGIGFKFRDFSDFEALERLKEDTEASCEFERVLLFVEFTGEYYYDPEAKVSFLPIFRSNNNHYKIKLIRMIPYTESTIDNMILNRKKRK